MVYAEVVECRFRSFGVAERLAVVSVVGGAVRCAAFGTRVVSGA